LEGSILLWAFVLGSYLAALTWSTRGRFPAHTPWALAVGHSVGVFFYFLVAGIASPFGLVDPAPADGPGPNPLLQNHILMVVHPPMLYLGYVGMSVPFAIGAASLLAGRLDAAWSALLRRWMLVPWGFLTVGIILGGWWSYEVLGWGGWWAWDPVENASFLPWLTATAVVHSAMVMERRDHLKAWTLTLVLATFLLTILGTFMTRSGVFNSVHSFTQSPIGPVFLGYLGVMLILSVVLLAARVDVLAPAEEPFGGPVHRESGFLVNNLLFAVFTFTVLLGTVWPLLNEAINGTQISVGQPYFDRMTAPIGLLLILLMAVGPALPWGRSAPDALTRRLLVPGAVGITVVVVCALLGLTRPWPLATFGLSAMALLVTLDELWAPARARASSLGEPLPRAIAEVFTRARRRYGGYIVHIGVLIIAVAHAGATAWSEKHTVTLTEGGSAQVEDYHLTYLGSAEDHDSHRRSLIARFDVKEGERSLGEMAPRLNHYLKMGTPIGTPEVESGLRRDLYLSLVNIDPEGKSVSVDVLIKPLVWWLWAGGAVMVLGTLLAAWPQRRSAAGT
jgi:cytochrome c-type biogenesis protein CcmF